MFQHSRRGTIVWLFIVGMALGLTLMAGGISPAVGMLLVAAYVGLAALVLRNAPLTAVLDALPSLANRQPQPTEVAREASVRARAHPDYDSLMHLIDIGLVVDEQRPDGLSLRRGRFISLDDDGIRPFATVHIPRELSEHVAHVRFELRDEQGQPRYVYETEKWLQAGENHLLPNYRLPIRKSAHELTPGGWTAHVIVDGGVIGIHQFSLSPSLAARRQALSSDGELRERVWQSGADDESLPLSLEELLRQQSRTGRQREG